METELLVKNRRLEVASFPTKDLTQVYPLTNGVGMMKSIVELVNWKQNQQVQKHGTNSRDQCWATIRLGEDDFFMKATA